MAMKHPTWTGVIVVNDRGDLRVRLDGLTPGGDLTGRRVGNTRERWYFFKEGGKPGLPPWWRIESAAVKSAVRAPGPVCPECQQSPCSGHPRN